MRQKKLCSLKLCVLAVVLLLIDVKMMAYSDIKVQLRLYEGQRKVGEVKPSVTTAYYLKPLFSGNLVLDSNLVSEQTELKKIFNLKGLKMLTKADWGWKYGKIDKQFEVIILNGHEFVIQLTLLKKRDSFRLEVVEKSAMVKKKILSSEVLLPQNKSSVFGFEDSSGKPFFLAFERSKDRRVRIVKPVRVSAKQRPKLIKMVKPVYPKVALRAKVQGQVILDAATDIYGRVIRLKVIKGHPLLTDAAIEAVKQWVYEPYILQGVPREVNFTVTVTFDLDKKGRKKPVKSKIEIVKVDKKPKLIKFVKPVYPLEAKEKKMAGFVKIEAVTDIYGRVTSARAMDGNPIFFKSALDAIKQWIYEPYIINGKPKAVKFTVMVKFNLDSKISTDE